MFLGVCLMMMSKYVFDGQKILLLGSSTAWWILNNFSSKGSYRVFLLACMQPFIFSAPCGYFYMDNWISKRKKQPPFSLMQVIYRDTDHERYPYRGSLVGMETSNAYMNLPLDHKRRKVLQLYAVFDLRNIISLLP